MRVFVIVVILSYVCVFAKEYLVVTATDTFEPLSKYQIKAIYLKKMHLLHDIKLLPLNLSSNDPVRRAFEEDVLGMHFNQLKRYWTKQHYLGHRPPKTLKSQESVIRFLKQVKGSIGYIEASKMQKGLKILYRWRR